MLADARSLVTDIQNLFSKNELERDKRILREQFAGTMKSFQFGLALASIDASNHIVVAHKKTQSCSRCLLFLINRLRNEPTNKMRKLDRVEMRKKTYEKKKGNVSNFYYYVVRLSYY